MAGWVTRLVEGWRGQARDKGYREDNPDVTRGGPNPLLDVLTCGLAEGRVELEGGARSDAAAARSWFSARERANRDHFGSESSNSAKTDPSVVVLAVGAMDVAVVMRVGMTVVVRRRRMMVVVPVIVRMGIVGMGIVGMRVMCVRVVRMVIVAALAMVVGRPLGFEGAGHRGGGAALAANELGGAAGHVESVGGDLGRHVAAAELPGKAQQPDRVLGPDLEERLAGGADRHEAAVLQAEGVAILQGRGLGQREGEAEAALPRQTVRRRLPRGVVEDDRVDDRVAADGDLADDGGGALHEILVSGWAGNAAPMSSGERITRGFFLQTERYGGTLTVRRAFVTRNA